VFLRGLSAAVSGEKGGRVLCAFSRDGYFLSWEPERLLGRVAAGSEQALGDPRGVWRGERCGRQVSPKNGQYTRCASVLQWVCIFLEGWR